MWHVSIALYGPHGGDPLPTDAIDRKRRRLAFALGERLLAGVGAGLTREQVKPVAFHVRRALSDQEIARIDPAWLALPAIDGADMPGSDPGQLVDV